MNSVCKFESLSAMDKEKLIELVSHYKLLYDPKEKYYSEMDKKDSAWREIGKIIGQPAEACRQQWNCLRDTYRRNLKRKKSFGPSSEKIKKWKFDEEMAFLKPFIREKQAFSFTKTCSNDEDEPEATLEVPLSTRSTMTEKQVTVTTPLTANHQPTVMLNPAGKIKHADTSTQCSEGMSEDADDLELFFSCMAKTVQRFSLINQALAKQQVFAAISDLEFKNMEEAPRSPTDSHLSSPSPTPPASPNHSQDHL